MMKPKLLIVLLLSCLTVIAWNNSRSHNESNTQTHATKRYLRKNANTPDASKDLEALNKAIKIMKQQDCSIPTSWYYQGALHWIPDTIVGKNKLCNSYQNIGDKKELWDNCTHTPSGDEEIHFLVWHRLYIYSFEKIVRKLSGYSEFALPYWGYADTTNVVLNRTMPQIFRDKSSNLYDQVRLDSLNSGNQISGETTDFLLFYKTIYNNVLYKDFNDNLDNGLHGAMHVYIGFGNDTLGKSKYSYIRQKYAYGDMASISTAAFDPIFWLHHSNIDRLWQQWTNSDNGQKVTLGDLNSAHWTYRFFDIDSNKIIEYNYGQILKILYNMDYDFDDTKVYEKEIPPGDVKTFTILQKSADTIAYEKPTTSIKNSITKFSIANKNTGEISLFNKGNKTGKILRMSIKVSYTNIPYGRYLLYFNLPNVENASPESKYFTGYMTFFGADHHHIMQGHEMNMDNKRTKTFNYEITNQAAFSKALSEPKFDITIIKFNGTKNEELKIESVTITKL